MPVRNFEEEQIPEDHDMEEPQRPMEIPQEMISQKRRPYWARDVIQGAKKYGYPKGIKISRTYCNYLALMCNLIDAERTCFEEDTKKEWMDVMIE